MIAVDTSALIAMIKNEETADMCRQRLCENRRNFGDSTNIWLM
jgi:uncharacterized protein with PIN domain